MDRVSRPDALLETQRAFDAVAATYDRSNRENSLLRAMRERARAMVDRLAPNGAHLLDLGCGPGSDAEYFARRGFRVTAIDWSPAMVQEARQRVADRRLGDWIEVHHLGVQEIQDLAPARFDAAYSNFGPLNCVPDLGAAARALASRLRPGAVFVASVIGAVCPWEVALYATRGDWRRAAIRFGGDAVAVPLEAETVWTRYFTPRRFEAAFDAAGFSRVALRGLGVLTPPPYTHAFADRHPALIRALQRIEDATAGWPVVRACGDHFLIALRNAS